ncbi:DNA sulfur modification protein DndD [Argonema antarcticum]|uniref:DNA sulfur modification protein DndD n=1 Tax=Argonema antarcticum TaxID=2942763 RepID=UPI00201309DB|nr:DNA sulfur modification protein DndD [Argonema antarcticum A004/B2]
MKFIELVLQNFGPYAGRQVINLSPEDNEKSTPIILFGGMNGGGKTTLMDAIRLALYGQRAQCSTRGNLGYSDFLTQCVNRHTPPTEKTRIELFFEHIEYNQVIKLRIVRYWTANPKDGKDHLGILDGEWPDTALAQTWDEYIENLLPLGISNLFLFDGEQVKELADLDTPPPLVVEAIKSLLGLELVDRLSVDLDVLVSRKRKQLAGAKELADLDEIERKLNKYNEEKEAVTQEQANLTNQSHIAKKNHQQTYNKFLSEGGKIAGEKSQLDQQLEEAKEKAQKQRQSLCELAAGALPLALIQPLLMEAEIQGEKESVWQQAQAAQNLIKERDRRLLDRLNQLQLTAQKIKQIQTFLDGENKTLAEDIGKPEEFRLGVDIETLKNLSLLLHHQLPLEINQAENQLQYLTEFESDIDSTERQLASAAAPEIYQRLLDAVNEAKDEEIKIKVAAEIADRKKLELENAIAQIKKDLAAYGEEFMNRKNSHHIITSAAKVQKTLQVFREKLTLKKLNKLEIQVTECFRYLLHKSNLVHRVVIDANNYSLSLYDPEGKSVPKHRLSAGEKQLLAIALLWGLARVSGRQLPVAIDTPLGRLDSSHRTNLVERYFPSASHQVILLSTDTEIGKIEVEKLREQDAIAREYLLKYDIEQRQTIVEEGYFW